MDLTIGSERFYAEECKFGSAFPELRIHLMDESELPEEPSNVSDNAVVYMCSS